MPNKDVTNSLKRTKKIDNKVNKNEKTSNLYKEFSNEKNAIYYVVSSDKISVVNTFIQIKFQFFFDQLNLIYL